MCPNILYLRCEQAYCDIHAASVKSYKFSLARSLVSHGTGSACSANTGIARSVMLLSDDYSA